MKAFPEQPSVSKCKKQHWWKPTRWMLDEDYHFRAFGLDLIIPFGFQFEASVPRPIWPLLGPTGTLFLAGLVHDWGYKKNPGKRSRAYWDHLFYLVAQNEKNRPFAHRIAWSVIRLGGWYPWRKHRRNDK